MNRSKILCADSFLRTRDNLQAKLLLSPSVVEKDFDNSLLSLQLIHKTTSQIAFRLENVLTEQETTHILKSSNQLMFQPMQARYEESKRRGSRLLTLDEFTANLIWNRVESVLAASVAQNNHSATPLGFGVTGGEEWKLDGINHAMRVNRQNSEAGLFAAHLDSQYCPTADKRSLFSMVIYLSDDFEGGETVLYFPHEELDCKGLNVEETLAKHGGLEKGFFQFQIHPKIGSAIIFSHDILHESMPIRTNDQDGVIERYVLRTDVLVSRQPRGLILCHDEKDDYRLCLEYFKEAQNLELKELPAKAGDLYERCLSIRYAYPKRIKTKNKIPTKKETCFFELLSYETILRLAQYLDPLYIQRLIISFPSLVWVQSRSAQLRSKFIQRTEAFDKIGLALKTYDHEPLDEGYRSGSCSYLSFEEEFFRLNVEGCCRVAALYAIFQMTSNESDRCYPVSFNPVTQEVTAVYINELLTSVFYGTKCFGAVYKVSTNLSSVIDDLQNSVDRTYMMMRHGAEFVGKDFLGSFHTQIQIPDDSSNEVIYKPKTTDSTAYGPRLLDSVEVDGYELDETVFRSVLNIDMYGKNYDNWDYDLYKGEGGYGQQPYLKALVDFNDNPKVEQFKLMDLCHCVNICICTLGDTVYERQNYFDQKVGADGLPIDENSDDEMDEEEDNSDVVSEIEKDAEAEEVFHNNVYVEEMHPESGKVKNLNVLIFDFSKNEMKVEPETTNSCESCLHLDKFTRDYSTDEECNFGSYRVDIVSLRESEKFSPFNHASCQCILPEVDVDIIGHLSYNHLDHVHVGCSIENGVAHMRIYFGGIVAF
ncbi:hypothetical protein HK098_004719 [Nowakowskiella sp. JEL0407]|nr:hypothetical protein HK098_004719 [Nowakowskiella sp. JEL0407]